MPQSSAELAKRFGGAPTTADLARQFGGTPVAPASAAAPEPATPQEAGEPDDMLSQIRDAVVGLWEKQPIHPVDIVTGTAEAVKHPIDTVSNIVNAQGVPLTRSKEALERGDLVGAATDFINYLIPVIGPQISEMQERHRKGELSLGGLVGESIGIGSQLALPEALRRGATPAVKAPALKPNPNAAEQAAVEFGQQRGVPIDAGTATGSRMVKGTQAIADRSLAGSAVSERAKTAQNAALTRVSGELADAAHPQAVSPYQAGEAATQGVEASMGRHASAANQAYDALRKIEADPANTKQVKIRVKMTDADGKVTMETRTVPMQMPVDLRAAKASLRPVYERMLRQMPVAQQRADPALHAIKNILDAPDYLPATMVDTDLSAIKALARTDGPRDVSQGLAANAVQLLDKGVQDAVTAAGQEAVDALNAGRAATKAKYTAADVLKQLRDEPVQVFDQATWANDAGIDRLRAIARESPGSMAKLGRAYLDKLFDTATAEGGFNKAGRIHSAWEKLGPQTKQLLFKNPKLVEDLDNFFLLAKRMADEPNPSGTGHLVSLTGQWALLFTNPQTGIPMQVAGGAASKLLRSPVGVRLLTRGLSVPLGVAGAKGQALSTWAAIQNVAKSEGVRLVPASATAEQEPAPAPGR